MAGIRQGEKTMLPGRASRVPTRFPRETHSSEPPSGRAVTTGGQSVSGAELGAVLGVGYNTGTPQARSSRRTMFRKALTVLLFLAAASSVVAVSNPVDAADDAAKAKKKAAAKKKAEPLKTDDIFKKLDANNDKALDVEEFKKLFTVQPEPKGKKGKEQGPFDLPFIFKSLDADGNKHLSVDEFKGIVPAVFPAPKK
jgi:hypothetical protein